MNKEKRYKPDTVRAALSKWHVGEESSDGEQRAFCPVCEDPRRSNSPSAMINADDGVWNCLKGNHGGSVYNLIQDLKKNEGFDLRSAVMAARNQDAGFTASREAGLARAGKIAAPLPSEDDVLNWTKRLLKSKAQLEELITLRGLSREMIVEHAIGWDGQRYTIPVRDAEGGLLNVRRYRLNAARSQDKMLNIPGHGSAQIYLPDVLEQNSTIVIAEGEMDCLLLNQFGIPAITHTAGAATFRTQWGRLFEGKTVYVCYDADDTGEKGAKKVKGILDSFALEVFIVKIPLPQKGADVTDYLHNEGHSAEDFLHLMKLAQQEQPVTEEPIPVSGESTTLLESMSEQTQGKVLELTVSIAGKQAEPFTAPREITASCDISKGVICNSCPLAAHNGSLKAEFRIDDPDVFRFVDVPETRRFTLLKEAIGARCADRLTLEIDSEHYIEELVVQQSVDDRRNEETSQPVRRTAFSIGTHRSAVNSKAQLIGRNVPDPKSGKLRFVTWHNEPVELDIDSFTLTDEIRARLAIFKPGLTQSPLDKCVEIAHDMSDNVTHIYGRPFLHVAYDLVWHSVASFKIHDVIVPKGWLEMMVVGDTRTGKSEVTQRLIRHYQAGILVPCEGMSFAGLVGGVQQIDKRWHMTWGVIPMNDRRLVALDEVSGLADKNVIDQMSSIRSSGIAQITKIQQEQTWARTRLIWISNPADGGMLASSSDAGMAALRSVIPNAEDQARFDFVMAAARGEVADDRINSTFEEMHMPTYRSEDCEALIKWAWSLRRNDVVISTETAHAAVMAARDLGKRYVPEPPLIQSENVRFKLLRIAAAIAARTFSADKNGKLVVEPVHVADAVRFLDEIYGKEAMGYARKSRRLIAAQKQAQERRSVTKAFLVGTGDAALLTLRMVGGNTFRARDFEELGGIARDEVAGFVRQLLAWRMIHLQSRGYMKMDPELLSILRELEDEE